MENINLVESFAEFKEFKNIDRIQFYRRTKIKKICEFVPEVGNIFYFR